MQPTSRKPIVIVLCALVIVIVAVVSYFSFSNPAPKVPETPPVVLVPVPAHTVIGHSVQGRAIDAYTYGNGSTTLVFVGGIHGGYEWNSVLLAYQFMSYIDQNSGVIPVNLKVTIIPDANPDAVFEVTGKEGIFAINDVSTSTTVLTKARFNADNVDLNRNFDCKWQKTSTWQKKKVSAGTSAFSEPEVSALRDYFLANKPDGVVFWHSAAGSVFASQCLEGILPITLDMMNTYAKAAQYPAVKTFDAYATTGAADDWLSTLHVPAITVELSTHATVEWDKNLLGIKALLGYFSSAPNAVAK